MKSDLTSLIATAMSDRYVQIALCHLDLSLNSFHGFACIGSVDLVIIGPLMTIFAPPLVHLDLFLDLDISL